MLPRPRWMEVYPPVGMLRCHDTRFAVVPEDNGLRVLTQVHPELPLSINPHVVLGVALSATHPAPIDLAGDLLDVWSMAVRDLRTAIVDQDNLPEVEAYAGDARWQQAVAAGAQIVGAKYTAAIDGEWHEPRLHLCLDPRPLGPIPTDRAGLAGFLAHLLPKLPSHLPDEPRTFPPGFRPNLWQSVRFDGPETTREPLAPEV